MGKFNFGSRIHSTVTHNSDIRVLRLSVALERGLYLDLSIYTDCGSIGKGKFLMAFEERTLDSSIDFGNVDENRVQMITGRGQMVYWKGCNVTVLEKDDEGKERFRKLVSMPNGQGRVESGTKLYVTDGKVKEE